ncbi:unnamed protein product [Closterium sp. NIES-53]
MADYKFNATKQTNTKADQAPEIPRPLRTSRRTANFNTGTHKNKEPVSSEDFSFETPSASRPSKRRALDTSAAILAGTTNAPGITPIAMATPIVKATVPGQEAVHNVQDAQDVSDTVMTDALDFFGEFNASFLEKHATPNHLNTLKQQAIADFKKHFSKYRTLRQQFIFMEEQKRNGIIPHSIRIKPFNFVCTTEDLRQEADKNLEAARLAYCHNAQDIMISMKKKAMNKALSDACAVNLSLQHHIDNFIDLNKKSDLGQINPKLIESLDFFKNRVLLEFKHAVSVVYMETNMAEIILKQKNDDINAKKAAAVAEAENLPVDPTVREIARQEAEKILKQSSSSKTPVKRVNGNVYNGKNKKVKASVSIKSKTNKPGVNVRGASHKKSTLPKAGKDTRSSGSNDTKKPKQTAAVTKKKVTHPKRTVADDEQAAVKTVGRSFAKTSGRNASGHAGKATASKNGGGGGRGKIQTR